MAQVIFDHLKSYKQSKAYSNFRLKSRFDGIQCFNVMKRLKGSNNDTYPLWIHLALDWIQKLFVSMANLQDLHLDQCLQKVNISIVLFFSFSISIQNFYQILFSPASVSQSVLSSSIGWGLICFSFLIDFFEGTDSSLESETIRFLWLDKGFWKIVQIW